jgi:hypothetical protein
MRKDNYNKKIGTRAKVIIPALPPDNYSWLDRTTCSRGHELKDNTYTPPSGSIRCRTCLKEADWRRKHPDSPEAKAFKRIEKSERYYPDNPKHGKYGTPAYVSWIAMKSRCYNPNSFGYEYYGGRGIKVCDKWLEFKGFYEDMGERPEGHTLDRIDNDSDYELSNCRWVSRQAQAINRRCRNKFGYKGVTKVKDRYECRITREGVYIYLGTFTNFEDAASMSLAAQEQL